MPTVSHVFMFKPRPGHLEGFLRDLGKINNVVKRAGGKMRVWNQVAGPDAGITAVVIENDDWKGYGAYRAKLEADPEFAKLRAEIASRKDPVSELVATGINEEVPS
jgi:hypothetical protein